MLILGGLLAFDPEFCVSMIALRMPKVSQKCACVREKETDRELVANSERAGNFSIFEPPLSTRLNAHKREFFIFENRCGCRGGYNSMETLIPLDPNE